MLIGGRLLFSLLLVAIQLYVLRAMLRLIGSVGLPRPKARLAYSAAVAFIVLVNVPLVWFIVESVINPRHLLLYSPPQEYESVVRPFSYTFFIWTLGSLMFAAASPFAMAGFAAVQFFRRRRISPEAGTIAVFDLSRRRFLQMSLMALDRKRDRPA